MEYWKGGMDWYTEPEWTCWACGADAMWLEWGLIHAECRCSRCGVHYFMRDDSGKAVTTPIVMTKEEYIDPFKKIWAKHRKHIDTVSNEMWDRYMEKA